MLRAFFKLSSEYIDQAVPNVWFELGEQHLPNPLGFPLIIWVPGKGPITGERKSIDQSQDDGTGANENPQAIFQRNVSINAYIFDRDYDHTERLMQHFVASMQRAAAGRWAPNGESWSMGWPAGTEEPSDHFKSGTLCILTFTLSMPLTREATPDVTGVAEDLTPQIINLEFS